MQSIQRAQHPTQEGIMRGSILLESMNTDSQTHASEEFQRKKPPPFWPLGLTESQVLLSTMAR